MRQTRVGILENCPVLGDEIDIGDQEADFQHGGCPPVPLEFRPLLTGDFKAALTAAIRERLGKAEELSVFTTDGFGGADFVEIDK